MENTNINHENYSTNAYNRQLKMSFDTEIFISEDDSVRFLSRAIDSMNLKCIERTNTSRGRNFIIPENIFLKILVYGYMNKLYSSRAIERACRRDVNFMWLLNGYNAPSHNTIALFRKSLMGFDDVFSQLVKSLADEKEFSFSECFIDGTKIESAANKYTFVWKGTTEKNRAKLVEKISLLYQDLLKEYGAIVSTLEEAKSMLEQRVKTSEQTASQAIDKQSRKIKTSNVKTSKEQKYLRIIDEYCLKLQKYAEYSKILGERNSFSKTDKDATFMRMKEDAMKNGQLKPAYNLQIAVSSEYVVSCMASSERNDNLTLAPFLDKIKNELSTNFQNICADSGYESEANYEYLKLNHMTSYIKPTNYEISKTRKYKLDKSKRENMEYKAESDFYICENGKKLLFKGWEKRKTKSGYIQDVKNYECESCADCKCKSKCTKAVGNKTLQFSPRFQELREESLQNIVSEYGAQLRVNRSIQVEGAFGVLKSNYAFKRFLMRGQTNIKTEFTLLCFAYNIKKLHAKTQSKRNHTYLHNLKAHQQVLMS